MFRRGDPLDYKWRARKALNASEKWSRLQHALCLDAIERNDYVDACRYATRLGHESHYHAWVTAKLRGRPILASMTARPSELWTDFTRNRSAYK